MTAKTEILDKIRRCFSIWSSDLKLNGKVNRLSDHVTSEDIAAGLLNLIYGYNLRNANEIHPNQKAIDLVDTDAEDGGGVAVQISTSNTRQKALKTMKGFCDASAGDPLCDEYSKLIFLILTVDDKFSGWEKLSAEDYTLEILNLTDLSNKIEHMELDPLKKILDYLNRHLQIETAGAVQPRDRIAPIARILDRDAVQAAAREMSQTDLDEFCMVDLSFPVMLRVVSSGRDVPHEQTNERLLELCRSGKPVILTGQSGTGKSTIMLRTAVSWAKGGDIALWLSPDENLSLTDAEAAQFYQDILSIIPAGRRALLCMDSPSLWSSAFAALSKNWPGESRLQLLMTERANRLSRMTDANNDLLHHWFDGATVAAMMYENVKNPLRIKDYSVEFIPEDYLRRQKILKNAVSVMFRMGQIRSVSENDAVRQIMVDYGKGSTLTELIYRAQFWLKDFATKPENLRMDWDEWKVILRKELDLKKSAQQLYGVIALCAHFHVPITVSLFCRHFRLSETDLVEAMNKWRMQKHVEPVIFRENGEVLLPKHDVIAELFFLFHRDTLPVNKLMTDLLNTMDTLEIEDFLEQIVQKGPIQKGYQFPVGTIFYRDYLTAIHRRFQNGDLRLFSAARARLALGLLYTVPKKDRRMGELTLPLVEGLDPGLDGSVLTASLYTEWGRLLADLNQKAAAEDKFRAVLQADFKNIHSRTELGRLLAKQPGREPEAEQFLREAMQIDPRHIQSRTELGRLLAKQPGRESEAEHFLRDTLEIKPEDIQSRTELGRLLAKQPGREEEAEHFLREAIRIDPKNLHPHTELGRLLAKQHGREPEAEHFLREILIFDPKNIQSRTELAKLCIQTGRSTEAERLYREVLRINPGNSYATEGLARLRRLQEPAAP